MPRLADRVAFSRGLRRRAIALGAGVVGALILAPINLGIALVVPMCIAVWLLDGIVASPGRSWRAAFAAGWWLGFGYHLAGFWWLGAAFLIDPEFKWLLPLGVVGLPAILALFTGAGFVLARLLWFPGPTRVLALAVGLALSEWARGRWFSGFPWNTFGMALGGQLVPAQLASLCGLDGLNLVAVALAAAPATLADPGRRRWASAAAALATLAAILAFGAIRLSPPPPADLPDVTIRLVQPGLRPDEAFTFENKDAIVDDYVALSERDDAAKSIALADVTMLVWPESPFPFILSRQPEELAKVAALLPPKTSLVTGAAREEDLPARDGERAHSDYYNAILVIARGGRILDSYDKVHLVPFGEYLPFNALLRRLGLRNFVPVPGGFEPGRERRPLDVPGLPLASPLICYEAIFPGQAMTDAGPRPRYLLNITNDGWFGVTTGPWQHLAQARLRTIEEGLPMVRGAATGISAFIDPYGRITGLLTLGDAGILDGGLSEALPPTLYARAGDLVFLITIAFTSLFLQAMRLVRFARR